MRAEVGVLFFCAALALLVLAGCNASGSQEWDAGGGNAGAVRFVPAPPPELKTESDGTNQPIYLFLFTHTEDPFNHSLSEERFTSIARMVERIAPARPEAHVTWTIEFQGSGAAVTADRNSATGVVDLLQDLASRGLVEFGYHAHHEPTYSNRPQAQLGPGSSWEEWVEGMDDWVSCEKDPLYGGCVAEGGGGLLAVARYFGPVEIVTGVYSYSRAAVEGGAARHAVAKHLPDRLLGFGFPDHGSSTEGDFVAALQELMTILTPGTHTSATVLWADDVIKINDGNVLDGVENILVHHGVAEARNRIQDLNRSRPHILNTFIGSKYIYTVNTTSPTKWGYAHPVPEPDYPDNPRLPPEYRNSQEMRETFYSDTEETLDYLAGELRRTEPEIRFVNSGEIIEMIAVDGYWEVTDAELDAIARWLLANWGTAPPAYAGDGDLFYSLRDSFVLLARALGAESPPVSQRLTRAYGPLSQEPATGVVELTADEIRDLAADLAPTLIEPETWTVTPPNILAPSYATSAGPINTAQLLYGMAMVYTSSYAGTPVSSVSIPATEPMPETLALLVKLGCPEGGCEGTAWSLKPARIHPLSSSSRIETPTVVVSETPTQTSSGTTTEPPSGTLTPTPTSTPTDEPTPTEACVGDCNRDGTVRVDELIQGVNIALGNALLSECGAFDADQDGEVTVNELIGAVHAALNGCGSLQPGEKMRAHVLTGAS